MFSRNCFVRCVGYRRSERYFTVGKVYRVVNGGIVNDNGYAYSGYSWNGRPMMEWLSDWYIFEEVNENATDNMVCSVCGEKLTDNEWTIVDGYMVCNSCKNEHVYFCDCCGRAVLDENSHYANNQTWCESCFDNYFRECAVCGEITYIHDMYSTHDGRVCCDCFDNYVECSDCGEYIHTDDAYNNGYSDEYYCEHCHNRRNRAIKPYNFKPIPIFRGSDNRNALYMGVELEIDGSGEDSDYAQTLLDIANDDCENVYIKHDGSLDDGMEIVSHPATLDYHLNDLPWKDIADKAISLGYRSHNTDTCGLHVHVSRRALGEYADEREETISKILYFIENNWDYVLRFTRRSERAMDEWASRYGIESDIKSTYAKAKGEWNRYRCLNLCNDNTIEFRMFRGSLNIVTLRATLEFVHNICTICKNASMDDIATMNWYDFLSRVDLEKYTDLQNYLNIRGLNV